MVPAGLAGLADLAQDLVLIGRIGRRQVRQRGEHGVALAADGVLLVAEPPPAGGERRQLLALLGRRRALAPAARAVLLGAQLLELGRQRPPALIELEQRSTAAAAPGPRRASAARTASGSRRISLMSSTRVPLALIPRDAYFLADFLPAAFVPAAVVALDVVVVDVVVDVVVGAAAVSGGIVPIGCESHVGWPTIFGAWRPAYLATNCATAIASWADDDVLRHDRAGEAAVLDRVQHARRRAARSAR